MNRKVLSNFNVSIAALTIFAFCLTIFGGLIGVVYYYNSSVALTNNISNTYVSRAEDDAELVHRVLEVFKTNIEGIAVRPEVRSMDWSVQKPVLTAEAARLQVLRIQVANLNGDLKSTNGKDTNIFTRDHFKRALQGETVISDPLVSFIDGKVIIVCATPIRNNDNKIVGVLTVGLDPEFIYKIANNRINSHGYIFIINSQGKIVTHPDKNKVLTDDVVALGKEKQKGSEDLTSIEQEMINGKTGFGNFIKDNEYMCLSYAPIADTDWSLGFVIPHSEAFSGLNTLRNQFLVITIIAVIFIIALGHFILRNTLERREIKKLNSDIEHSKKLLKESEEMEYLRTQFFANISHELRTPLNVISGTLQLFDLYIKTKPELSSIDKHVKTLKQNSKRLLKLINNLIDISRIDAGFYEIHLVNQDIVKVVSDIVSSIDDYAKSKGITVFLNSSSEKLVIAFDIDKTERIILNLLSNALKFTDNGGTITVNISAASESVIISVSDTGIGIPLDKQKTIFERFIKVDQSLTRTQEGSGIGLSLVKSLVEIQGGKVSVNSEVGQGSEFIIELPLRIINDKNVDNDINQDYNFADEKMKEEFSDIYLDY